MKSKKVKKRVTENKTIERRCIQNIRKCLPAKEKEEKELKERAESCQLTLNTAVNNAIVIIDMESNAKSHKIIIEQSNIDEAKNTIKSMDSLQQTDLQQSFNDSKTKLKQSQAELEQLEAELETLQTADKEEDTQILQGYNNLKSKEAESQQRINGLQEELKAIESEVRSVDIEFAEKLQKHYQYLKDIGLVIDSTTDESITSDPYALRELLTEYINHPNSPFNFYGKEQKNKAMKETMLSKVADFCSRLEDNKSKSDDMDRYISITTNEDERLPSVLLGIEQYPEYKDWFLATLFVSKSQALNTTYKSQIIATLKIKNIDITDEIIKGAEKILEEIPKDEDHPFWKFYHLIQDKPTEIKEELRQIEMQKEIEVASKARQKAEKEIAEQNKIKEIELSNNRKITNEIIVKLDDYSRNIIAISALGYSQENLQHISQLKQDFKEEYDDIKDQLFRCDNNGDDKLTYEQLQPIIYMYKD